MCNVDLGPRNIPRRFPFLLNPYRRSLTIFFSRRTVLFFRKRFNVDPRWFYDRGKSVFVFFPLRYNKSNVT